ncbi:MAG TPA: polyprenol monophosphomannose synthase [Nitrososphaerales archaeon]|nr:polyprenol monophosphomannose synthase [Nitrososphaerales archaeon]
MTTRPPSKVCMVIPTYNEKENVGPLLERIGSIRKEGQEVLFVDDSSPDGTADLIREAAGREAWVHLYSRGSKKGIGSAYLEGFQEAIDRLQADVVVEMDADLQHPPEQIPALLQAVEGGADVAIGSRYVKGGGSRGWGSLRKLVSWGANWQARTFLRLGVNDCTSGFRAYRKRAAQKLISARLPATGFEFQVAALFALKTDMKMVEVPYVFDVRTAGKSKLGPKAVVRFFAYVVWTALG